MVVSELINTLQKLKDAHGDLPVCLYIDYDEGGYYKNISDNDIVVDGYAQPHGRFKDYVKSVLLEV